MSCPTELSAAAELAYLRRAVAEGLLRVVDLASHCRCKRPTASNWLAGRKRGPQGLFFAALRCMTPGDRAVVLGWVAEDHRAGTVISLAERRAARQLRAAALAYIEDAPARPDLVDFAKAA